MRWVWHGTWSNYAASSLGGHTPWASHGRDSAPCSTFSPRSFIDDCRMGTLETTWQCSTGTMMFKGEDAVGESRFIKTFGSLRVWRMGLGWTKCPSKKLTGCNGSSQPHCHHRQKEWHCIGSHQRQPQVSKMWVSCLFWSCHWWFQKNHWEPALVN